MKKPVTVAIVGLGSRGGDAYASCQKLFPEKMKIVAIADIIPEKVDYISKEYNVPKEMCFESAEHLLQENQLADVLFICTQDRQHVGHALPALRKGYDLLLEKPISPDLQECREILQTAHELHRKVVVCHVLRYTPYYRKLKEVLDSGRIGDVVTVMGIENVGYYHHAHSFVRGNWRRSDETSPMILQKCCHDFDMLLYLTGKTCNKVSSFGSTYLFREDKAPLGSSDRCLNGCRVQEHCPFDCEKIYITNEKTGVLNGHTEWPNNVLTLYPTESSIRKALQDGPYGRCVYRCDNTVLDHQVVNLEMTDGSTISFTMSGFSEKISRYTKFMGTKGEIIADMGANTIEIWEFGKDYELIDMKKLEMDLTGHGGGDSRLVESFLDLISDSGTSVPGISSLEVSVESHYIALAAEKSRLQGGQVVSMEEMREV